MPSVVRYLLYSRTSYRFRWVFCQLDFLSRCLPPRIRRALNELPETLDGTYERTLGCIDNAKWEYAKRLLQCITVASRPLRVEEVAEFLAFDFGDGAVPGHNSSWRPEDPGDAVLSTCSSLLAIVDVHGSKVIQFSHYSVKEFLMSDRIAEGRKSISRYHVLMQPAHTTMLQVCLVILLNLTHDANKEIVEDKLDNPLSLYAAQHWVDHARFGNDSARAKDFTRQIFDPRKPHFSVWIQIHDVLPETSSIATQGAPQLVLRYASVCGLPDVVEFLITKCSQNVNPLSDRSLPTPLYLAAKKGYDEVIKLLLRYGANVNAIGSQGWTALHVASANGYPPATQVLLDHCADPNVQDDYGETPLHCALENGHLGISLSLIKHTGDQDIRDDRNMTPLHLASERGYLEVVLALLERHADASARSEGNKTPLHRALENRRLEVIQALLQHGVDPNTWYDKDNTTVLYLASAEGYLEAVRTLLDHGADPNIRDDNMRTPLHIASKKGYLDVVVTLLDREADVNALNEEMKTPLCGALGNQRLAVVRALLGRDADPNTRDYDNSTPLHLASVRGPLEIVQVLLKHGANVISRDNGNNTPLHLAYKYGHADIVDILLEHGADANSRNNDDRTPLQLMLGRGR